MSDHDYTDAISSVDEIIDDARNGRMFILIDHEERENEGDLVIPAQMATPENINFMATHGRGLICLALPGERIDALGLPLMSTYNSSRHETAFTISIEAREGVSTGISAHDRARTVAVAIDPSKTSADIATPGHVFPLKARDGGVLVRAGHTEAAVDVSRLAGLNPSRRRHDNLVNESHQKAVTSEFGGDWMMRVFTDETEGAEHVVLTKGDLSDGKPVLTRMHALNPIEDVLGLGPSPSDQLPRAMEVIAEEGRGVVVMLRDLHMKMAPEGGVSPQTLRQYGLGAQILAALGLSELELLTNSPSPKIVGLEAYGLSITGTRPIPMKG